MTRRAARLVLLFFALLLAACAPAPFSRADLEAALFQDGDLPPEWAPGQPGGSMVGDPDLRHFASSRPLLGPGADGQVSVGLYRSRDHAARGLLWMLHTERAGVAPILVGDEGFIGASGAMFRRGACLAVLNLQADDADRSGLLEGYGRRLDERLRELGC